MTGFTASSDSNTPTPAIGMQFAPPNPKRSIAKSDLGTVPTPSVAQSQKRSNRVPSVKPAVHDANPEPEIASGELGAEATPPTGNFFTRMVSGKKEPAKRVLLPLAENQSIHATTDEALDGF
jgi:hypothetical protein